MPHQLTPGNKKKTGILWFDIMIPVEKSLPIYYIFSVQVQEVKMKDKQ